MNKLPSIKRQKELMAKASSYEAVCKELGRVPLKLESFGHLPEHERLSAFGEHKIKTLAEFLNDGVVKDWNNRDQWAWAPYFDMRDKEGDTPGSGFRFPYCHCGDGSARLGARLTFATEEYARFAGTEHIDSYREMIRG